MAKKKKKKKAEHYRTGQYVKPKRTGKVTTNLSQEEWEIDTSKPITSRTGVIGHKKKLKKKGELYPKVKIEDLPTSRKQRLTAKERKELIGMGVDPGDIKATVEEKKVARVKQRAGDQVKKEKKVSAGDRRGPHFRDPVTGKVPDSDDLWSLRHGEGAPKETDEQRTARLKRERAKKAKYEAEHRKPYTLEEIGKKGFKNRAMKEEYERGLKREQFLKGVTTPPRKPRNVLEAITDKNVLPAIIDERTEGYAGMKKGGSTRRKTGGALGTGAALRGYGKGYKKGGTI